MKKWWVSLAAGLAVLTGCNQETIEDAEAEDHEIIHLEDVEVLIRCLSRIKKMK